MATSTLHLALLLNTLSLSLAAVLPRTTTTTSTTTTHTSTASTKTATKTTTATLTSTPTDKSSTITSHQTLIIALSSVLSILILAVAAYLIYRQLHRPSSSSTSSPKYEKQAKKDRGFHTTYWNETDAPASHPMLSEMNQSMIHAPKDEFEGASNAMNDSDSLLARPTTSMSITQSMYSPNSMPPPPAYEGAASSELRPAPLRPRSVSPGREQRAPCVEDRVEQAETRGRSRDRPGMDHRDSLVPGGGQADRARSKSFSRFREEGMMDVDVSDSMSMFSGRGR